MCTLESGARHVIQMGGFRVPFGRCFRRKTKGEMHHCGGLHKNGISISVPGSILHHLSLNVGADKVLGLRAWFLRRLEFRLMLKAGVSQESGLSLHDWIHTEKKAWFGALHNLRHSQHAMFSLAEIQRPSHGAARCAFRCFEEKAKESDFGRLALAACRALICGKRTSPVSSRFQWCSIHPASVAPTRTTIP